MNNEEMSKSIRYNCCKSDRYNINFHICYLYLKKNNNNNNNLEYKSYLIRWNC